MTNPRDRSRTGWAHTELMEHAPADFTFGDSPSYVGFVLVFNERASVRQPVGYRSVHVSKPVCGRSEVRT